MVCPDQRGFGASDKPVGVEHYKADRIVEDLIALADALEIGRFTLVGHDWGGAVAWLAALRHPDRIQRLVIVNAPHPLIFQKSLIEDPLQRAASQYITAFRNPAMERGLEAMGLETFYAKTFASHADISKVSDEERAAYLADWGAPGALTAMLNWYRASEVVVPAPGEAAELPAWTKLPFPVLQGADARHLGDARHRLAPGPARRARRPRRESRRSSRSPTPAISSPGRSPRRWSGRSGISCGAHSR